MILLSIGDRIEDGTYRLHSEFRRAVNFTDDRRMVFLVDEEIGAGPLNIVCRGSIPKGIGRLTVASGRIEADGQVFPCENQPRYSSRLKMTGRDVERIRRRIGRFTDLLRELAPARSAVAILEPEREKDFQSRFERRVLARWKQGMAFLTGGQWTRGARLLKGCGWGLTPSGDDLLAGYLIGLNSLKRRAEADRLFDAARGGNLLADVFLKLARDGLVMEKLGKLLASLVDGTERDVREYTMQWLAYGHTSGADLATGLVLAMRLKN